MKLLRYGPVGNELPGILDVEGRVRDLSMHCEDFDLGSEVNLIERLSRVDIASLPIVVRPGRLGPPLASVNKFIAIGLNYRDHAREANLPIPAEPIVFTKANSCIIGPNDDVILPRGSVKTDWEVELGVVIGKRASYIEEAQALEHVAGYLLVNDLSEREFQNERGGTWDKGKGCDTFGPIGPWLVTKDEIQDPQTLDMWLNVNDEPRQRGNSRNMIFSCAEIVAYVSQFMTLVPGDIITTGTPPGVGMGMMPPLYLQAGDIVTLGIEGLGEQRQVVRSPDG